MHGKYQRFQSQLMLSTLGLSLLFAGCRCGGLGNHDDAGPEMLGTKVDALNMTQEINAEASKFVVYTHEFESQEMNSEDPDAIWRLNDALLRSIWNV